MSSEASAERPVTRAGGWWMLIAIVGGGLIAVAALYGLRYAWFYAGKAGPPARLPIVEIPLPVEQRAWPVYRDALLAMGFPDMETGNQPFVMTMPTPGVLSLNKEYLLFDAWAVPGDRGWWNVEKFLEHNAEAVEALRRGTAKQVLGVPAAEDAESVAERVLLERHTFGPDVAGAAHLERPATTSLARRVARVLQANLMAAALAGDQPRVRADTDALFQLLDQFLADEEARADPVLLLAAQHAMEALDQAVRYGPDGFTVEDLASIDGRLAKFDPFAVSSLDAAAAGTRDALATSFTDDGDGDGRMLPGAAASLTAPSGRQAIDEKLVATPEPWMRLLRPILTLDAAGRAESAALLEAWAARDAAEWRQPLHERWTLSSDAELEALAADPRDARRFRWLLQTQGFLSAARRRAFAAQAHRDASRLLLHLAAERMRTGSWPPGAGVGTGAGAGGAAPAEVFGRPLPADPLTGEPIRWALLDGEVCLYSLGADGDDDGGRSSNRPPFGAFADPGLPAAARPDGDWVLTKTRAQRGP